MSRRQALLLCTSTLYGVSLVAREMAVKAYYFPHSTTAYRLGKSRVDRLEVVEYVCASSVYIFFSHALEVTKQDEKMKAHRRNSGVALYLSPTPPVSVAGGCQGWATTR